VQFWPVTPAGLRAAIARVASLWADRAAWGRMQARGMAFDVSWAAPGKRYAALFKEAVLF
jgi:starch synthase